MTIFGFCLLLVLGGCGGDDTDFSKPPTGLPTVPPAEPANADVTKAGAPPAPAAKPAAPPTGQPAASKGPAKPAASVKATPGRKGKISIGLGKGSKDAVADEGTPNLEGLPEVEIVVARDVRSFGGDDDDDDRRRPKVAGPSEWRTQPFELRPLDRLYLDSVNTAALSETGELAVGIDKSVGEVLVFDSRFGKLRGFFKLDDATPQAVAISQKYEQVILLDSLRRLHIFDVPDLRLYDSFARREFLRGQIARKPMGIGDTTVSRMEISNSGEVLWLGTEDGKVELRSLGKRPAEGDLWPADTTLESHESRIFAVSMTANDAQLVSTAEDGSVKLWDLATQETIAELPKVKVPAFAVCPVEDGFAIGRATGTIEVWTDPGQDSARIREYYVNDNKAVTELVQESKQGLLFAARVTGQAQLMRLSDGSVAKTNSASPAAPVMAASTWPSRERLLTISLDGTYFSWEALRDRGQGSAQDIDKPVNKFFVSGLMSNTARQGQRRLRAPVTGTHSKQNQLDLEKARSAWQAASTKASAELLALREAAETDRQASRASVMKEKAAPVQVKDALKLLVAMPISLDEFDPKKVRLVVSDSGDTLALSKPPGPLAPGKIEVWDVPSQTLLREWETNLHYESLRLPHKGHWLIAVPTAGIRREDSIGYYNLRTGRAVVAAGDPVCVATGPEGRVAIGFQGRFRETTDAVVVYNPEQMKQVSSLRMFETRIPAMTFLSGNELVLSVRERLRRRLLVATIGSTITEGVTLDEEKVAIQPWVTKDGLAARKGAYPGVNEIVAFSGTNNLVTHAKTADNAFHFGIWIRTAAGEYPRDKALLARRGQPFLRAAGLDATRICTTSGGSIGVITPIGVATIDPRKGTVRDQMQLDESDQVLVDRRGNWLAIADVSGTLRIASFGSLDTDKNKFRAHDGPMITMAESERGKHLATLGEEGLIKVWKLSEPSGNTP